MTSGEGEGPSGSGGPGDRPEAPRADAHQGAPRPDPRAADAPAFAADDDGGFDPDGALARIRAREAMEVLRSREREGPGPGSAGSPPDPKALGSSFGTPDGLGARSGDGLGGHLGPDDALGASLPPEGALGASLPPSGGLGPAHWTEVGASELDEALPFPDPAEEASATPGPASSSDVETAPGGDVDPGDAAPDSGHEGGLRAEILPSGEAGVEPSALDTAPPSDESVGASAPTPVDSSSPLFETPEDPRIPAGRDTFRIGEVARVVGVKPYVLRYWETEFDCVEPEKTSTNQRRYRREDVAKLLRIRRLRHDAQLTVAQTRAFVEAGGEGPALPSAVAAAEALTGLGSAARDAELGPGEVRRLRACIAEMRSAVLELLEAIED